MHFNFYVLFIILVIVGLLGVQNKKVRPICTFITFIFVFFIMTSARAGDIWSDLDNYRTNYLRVAAGNESDVEILYLYLVKLGSFLGLSFYEWKTLIVFIELLALCFVASKFTDNIIFVLLCYSLNLMFIDIEVFRNALAYIILNYGMYFLLRNVERKSFSSIDLKFAKADIVYKNEKKEWKSILIYVICVLIAVQIHSGFLIYLTFIFIKMRKRFFNVINKLIIPILLVIVFLLFNTNILTNIMKMVSLVIENEKYMNYAVQKSRYGWTPLILICGATLGLSIYNYTKIRSGNGIYIKKVYKLKGMVLVKSSQEIDIERMAWLIVCVNIISFLMLMPMSILSLHFSRLIRNLSYLNICFNSLMFQKLSNNKNRKQVVLWGTIAITVMWFLYDYYAYSLPVVIEDTIIQYGDWFWKNLK